VYDLEAIHICILQTHLFDDNKLREKNKTIQTTTKNQKHLLDLFMVEIIQIHINISL